jgi:hypothetical protein
MTDKKENVIQRRRFLQVLSTGALVAPIVGLGGCSEDKAPTGQAPSKPAADMSAEEPAAKVPAEEMASSEPAEAPSDGGLPRLDPNDPQAKSLNYVHDASTVDSAKFPQYSAGKVCSNCALYTGKAGPEWGPCSIFPGKQVNANGWCSVYAPKG